MGVAVDMGAYEYGSSTPPPEYCWSHRVGGLNADEAHAVCADGSGNIYMTGGSHASWGSPVRAYTDNGDAFAAKLDVTAVGMFFKDFAE